MKHGTRNLILGHLSEENNTPELAEKTAVNRLSEFKRDRDYFLMVAKPETTGDMVVI